MINQVPRNQRDVQGQGQGVMGIALDNLTRPAISHKKEQNYHTKQSIQSQLTRLYFEELAKNPSASTDSILVGCKKN